MNFDAPNSARIKTTSNKNKKHPTGNRQKDDHEGSDKHECETVQVKITSNRKITAGRREAEDVYESESVVESSSKLPEEAVVFPEAASVKGEIHQGVGNGSSVDRSKTRK